MANRMKGVAKLLGVELGKEFYIEGDKDRFKITNAGVEYYSFAYRKWFPTMPIVLEKLLNGTFVIKDIWTPDSGQVYYYPIVDEDSLCCDCEWHGEDTDYHRLDNGLVFETKEEAIELAKKMLETAREEHFNE